MGSLYHATRIQNLVKIIETNTLYASPRRGVYGGFKFSPDNDLYSNNAKGERGGVSLTRSYDTANNWYGDVVIELDYQKLSHNYKITPINMAHIWGRGSDISHWSNKGAKYEELYEEMVFGPIKNLNKYLVGIYFKRDLLPDTRISRDDIEFIMKHPLYKGIRNR